MSSSEPVHTLTQYSLVVFRFIYLVFLKSVNHVITIHIIFQSIDSIQEYGLLVGSINGRDGGGGGCNDDNDSDDSENAPEA